MSAQERAALAYHFLLQAPMTTRDLADRLNMSRQGAWALLTTISRVVAIYYDDGQWRLLKPPSTGG